MRSVQAQTMRSSLFASGGRCHAARRTHFLIPAALTVDTRSDPQFTVGSFRYALAPGHLSRMSGNRNRTPRPSHWTLPTTTRVRHCRPPTGAGVSGRQSCHVARGVPARRIGCRRVLAARRRPAPRRLGEGAAQLAGSRRGAARRVGAELRGPRDRRGGGARLAQRRGRAVDGRRGGHRPCPPPPRPSAPPRSRRHLGGPRRSRTRRSRLARRIPRALPNAAPWITDERPDHSDAINGVAAPALLLWGDADPVSPISVGERLADLLPKSTLEIIEGGEHQFAHDHPNAVARLIAAHLG